MEGLEVKIKVAIKKTTLNNGLAFVSINSLYLMG